MIGDLIMDAVVDGDRMLRLRDVTGMFGSQVLRSQVMVTLSPPCPECEERSQILMTREQADRWDGGRGPFVQVVFWDWTADERELLLTGTHPECWDAMFPPESE
jgi:hypothetical protein